MSTSGWRLAAGGLFPAPPPKTPRLGGRSWWRLAAVGAAVVVGGTLVSLLRHPGTIAVDTVYAEDGSIFLAEAVNTSPLGALSTSYAGYFHLVPRLLGGLAAAFPAAWAAALLAVSAAAVTAILAGLVYVASAGHLDSRLARLLVSAPVVVAPLAQEEVPNAVANLHWPALYALFWMLLWTPAGRAGRVVAPVVVALTALSDILVMAFLPLAAVRLLARRDRYSALLGGVLAIGVAVQLSGLLTGSSEREVTLDPVQPVTGFVLRAVPAAVFGDRFLPDAGADPRRLALAALAWLLLLVIVVIAGRTLSQPRWTLAAAAGAHSLALYALPVVLTGVAPPRYALAPALLLLTAAVALLDPVARHHRAMVPLVVLAVFVVTTWAVNYRVATERELGPLWSEELDRAVTECVGPGTGSAPVSATPADPEWTFPLSCAYLTR